MPDSVPVVIQLTADGLNTNLALPGPLWQVERVYVEGNDYPVEVRRAGPPPAELPFWRQSGGRLTIVPIPPAGRLVVLQCTIPGPLASHPDLERMVLGASPGDDGPALVWADWLLLQGDLRGEAVAACPRNAHRLLVPSSVPMPAYKPRLRLSLQQGRRAPADRWS